MTKQKVLFLMFAFPDMNKSFNMYTALVDEFHQNGHSVKVLAPAFDGRKTSICIENNIEVLRVKTLPIKNVSNWKKGISNLLLPYLYYKALKRHYSNQKFDAVIMPTPPITLGKLASRIKKVYGAKLYLILRDIFPQNAVDLGFIKKGSLIHRFFEKKEKKLYNSSDSIGCMSQGNIDYILKHHPNMKSDKLHILRNWQYPFEGFGHKPSELRAKYNLGNKFVVVFGGNMGKPQQLENVLELARHCMKIDDVVFLLLGEGVAMDRLAATIRKDNIYNILIQPTIPKQEYQDLLKVCNVGLISLHEDFTIPNIPSKALDYFNVGIPILASLDKATDFGAILDEERLGKWSFAGDHEQLFENFLMLYKNRASGQDMGARGKAYFNGNLRPGVAYTTIIDKLA